MISVKMFWTFDPLLLSVSATTITVCISVQEWSPFSARRVRESFHGQIILRRTLGLIQVKQVRIPLISTSPFFSPWDFCMKLVPLALIHVQQNTSLHSKRRIHSKGTIPLVFPCLSPPCQVRSPLPAAGPTVRRSLPALTSWCATTACTRGTWPSCSLPSEQEEEEEEEGDNMLCQLVEKDAGTWSAYMVPCQTWLKWWAQLMPPSASRRRETPMRPSRRISTSAQSGHLTVKLSLRGDKTTVILSQEEESSREMRKMLIRYFGNFSTLALASFFILKNCVTLKICWTINWI